METPYMELARKVMQEAEYRCPVCGSPRYVTGRSEYELTLHCASRDAKFWEFPRGSFAETVSRQHWDQSELELSFKEDHFLPMTPVL